MRGMQERVEWPESGIESASLAQTQTEWHPYSSVLDPVTSTLDSQKVISRT